MTRRTQPHRTIRELGGELWAELSPQPEEKVPRRARAAIVDILMGVLARHAGSVIENDRDLPVEPLPHPDLHQRYREAMSDGAKVFLLFHWRFTSVDPHSAAQEADRLGRSLDDTEEQDVKLLGVYSSRAAAEARIERACQTPGFREHPNTFHIDAYVIDRDEWSSGFGPAEPV